MTGRTKRSFAYYLALYGCISTGIIYIALGVVAMLSFLKVRKGGADEGSLLAILNNSTAGYVLVCIILLGTLCYILWRIYEAIRDPYEYGKSAKGIATRAGIALSTVADGFILYSAYTALLGTSTSNEDGRPVELQRQVGDAMSGGVGGGLIICIGIIISATAIVQLVYGITKGYRERLDIGHMKRWKRNLIHSLGITGYFARSIILGIIGFFFIKAGITKDAQQVVNTDKAFDFIGDHIGHVFFILAAAGTICYGIFMCLFGVYYDTDKD
jgi:hypothetical protein